MNRAGPEDLTSSEQTTARSTGTAAKRDRRERPLQLDPPAQLGERYLIDAVLGRGGMAVVYSARDQATGRALALKRLARAPGSRDWSALCSLFQREFHLLAQLSHPNVIEVYDYALEDGTPYYTMELLDGGDLRQLSPLPFRALCALMYDVCSSLALLHSRRFVHRDISPVNVRRTRAGKAKLIDFGAAVPMGPVAHLVGTPAFVPPEALNRGVLDARSDLYSLGATIYFALSGQLAYPARSFAELPGGWGKAPTPLSKFVPDIPPALDELVMSLLSLDAAMRPRSAFHVMQRLSAIANLHHAESLEVPRAYLSAPSLVGRDATLARIRAKLALVAHEQSGSASVITGPRGAGRTRMLDASVLAAKLLGVRVLRTGAGYTRQSFSIAQTALEQLQETLGPALWTLAQTEGVAELLFEARAEAEAEDGQGGDGFVARDLSAQPHERWKIQAALETLLCALARSRPLLLAVDDVHAIDAASIGLLAGLSARCQGEPLALLFTADSAARTQAPRAFSLLGKYCEPLELPPLDRAASEALVESMFGDVPNVALVSQQLYERARGNPGSTLNLAEWLIDRDVIRYEAGAWSLPSQLSPADLPADGEQASAERLRALSPLARELVCAQALSILPVFSRQDYLTLASAHAVAEVERALLELVATGALTSDGQLYELASRELVLRTLPPQGADGERAVHRALTRVFLQPDKPLLLAAHHMLLCGLEAEALARITDYFAADTVVEPTLDHVPVLPYAQRTRMYLRALQHADLLRPRELGELRRRLLLLSVVDDPAVYYQVAPAWLAQLRSASGLDHLHAIDPALEPGQRVGQAITTALAHYEATPENERSYRPDEAIRLLAQYVVVSLAISGHALDGALANSLPDLLEPFTLLSPALQAIHENALGARLTHASRRLAAKTHFRRAFQLLTNLSSTDFPYVRSMTNAIVLSIAATDATLGLSDSAELLLRLLDDDPMQRVNAMYVRRIVALQRGDWEQGEEYRRQAELLELQSNVRQMFVLDHAELIACARAGDLVGVRYVCERLEAQREKNPNTQAFVLLASGLFQHLRGDLQQAQAELSTCLELCDPRSHGAGAQLHAFYMAAAAYVEVLYDQRAYVEAHEWGLHALATLHELRVEDGAWELERTLALVEAKFPELVALATQRIMRLIQVHHDLGVVGQRLGACYEVRTRIAIGSGDQAAAAHYARLTAQAYRYGEDSMFAARCERLREEARLAKLELPF